jgi:hypothetical protein
MVSCGYETPAVIEGFGSWKGFKAMVRGTFNRYPDAGALKLLDEVAPHASVPLVQIEEPVSSPEETHV